MTTTLDSAGERRSVGDHGLTISNEDPELADIVIEALPSLGWLGNRLSRIAGDESRGTLKDSQLALTLELLGATTSSLFACVDTKCNLDPTSPPSEVDRRPRGPNKSMISRCHHNPPHCWNNSGEFIECP